MNPMYIKYSQLIDKLSIQYRILVLIGASVFITLIWYFSLWQSLQNEKVQTVKKITQLTKDINLFQEQLKIAENSQSNLVKELQNKRIQLKKLQEAAAASQIPKSDGSLIAPQNTTQLLYDLLHSRHNLELIQFKILPAEKTLRPNVSFILYKYGIIMKFSGTYFAVMGYLEALEKLGLEIYWDRLDYVVTTYPKAEVTLQIHTLSEKEGLIHV